MAELIGNERVDDIPLLLNQMKRLNLSGLVDEHFAGHGNWQGYECEKVADGLAVLSALARRPSPQSGGSLGGGTEQHFAA